MTELFLKIVNMSITASIAVLLVLILRILFKKAPKWVSVLLWGVAAVRLISPFGIESPLSLMPKTDWIESDSAFYEYGSYHSVTTDETVSESTDGESRNFASSDILTTNPKIGVSTAKNIPTILSFVWICGISAMLVYMVFGYCRVFLLIRSSNRLRDNIFTSDKIPSPFVFGVIRPRICLPHNSDSADINCVIAHEEAHIKRGDHIWKPLGFLLLTLHWFNPLIWIAYMLFCRDIEMACDEKVVKNMSSSERADYSEALLEYSIKPSKLSAFPPSFGEIGVKQRIKSVLNYKKPAFLIMILAVIACVAAAICFLTNPITKIDYTFDADIADSDTVYSGTPEYSRVKVSINGKISRDFFGKATFNGSIVIDGKRYDNELNLSQKTPILSYYSGPRLVSSAYILAHSSNLSKLTIVLLETESEPRRYVFCNMTYDEAVRLQKINELPESLPKEKEPTAASVIDSNISEETLSYEILKQHQEKIWEYRNTAVSDTTDHVFRKWGERISAVGVNQSKNCVDVYVYDFDIGDIGRFKKALGSCSYTLIQIEYAAETFPENKKQLTLGDVISLSEKGEKLVWEDFAMYSSTETGSGLYIRVYDIDESFELIIGGGSPTGTPMYIRLKLKDSDRYADVTKDDIPGFIAEHTSDRVVLYDHPLDYYFDLAWEEAEPIALSKGYRIKNTNSNRMLLHDNDKNITVVFSDSSETENRSEIKVYLHPRADGSYAAENSVTVSERVTSFRR